MGEVCHCHCSKAAVCLILLRQNDAIIIKSPIEVMKSIKNETEVKGETQGCQGRETNTKLLRTGMKAAYLRDAVAWAQWMAWLERKMSKEHRPNFTEYDAAERLTALRASQPLFAGLAYENISATGANAGK